MISKKHRFHGLNSLNHAYRKGQGARNSGLTIKTLPNRRGDYRLAVVISKKVHKSAAVRNRIRRRIYEAVRLIKQQDERPWPYDIIISCFDEKFANYPAEKAQKSVENLLSRAGVRGKI